MKEQYSAIKERISWKYVAALAAGSVLLAGVLNETDHDTILQTTQGMVLSREAGRVTVGYCIPTTCSPTIAQLRHADLAAVKAKNAQNFFDTYWKFEASTEGASCNSPNAAFVAQLELGDIVVRERHQEALAHGSDTIPQYRQYCEWKVA